MFLDLTKPPLDLILLGLRKNTEHVENPFPEVLKHRLLDPYRVMPRNFLKLATVSQVETTDLYNCLQAILVLPSQAGTLGSNICVNYIVRLLLYPISHGLRLMNSDDDDGS